jgi:hypothetical protein
MAAHKRRLKAIQPATDFSPPASMDPSRKDYGSPIKKVLQSQAVKDRITKDNLLLAKRIFAIMEGPGFVSEMMTHYDHLDRHPGTLNFDHRLAEAKRIHRENVAFASRLDTMQPYYHSRFDNDVVLKIRRKQLLRKKRRGKSPFSKGLRAALEKSQEGQNDNDENDSEPQVIEGAPRTSTSASSQRKQHVLLEYTKSQGNRVLDVAVVKEPFRDRYIIFGIDIDDGQRFELQLTSEDVSSIVDGDLLVTSVDHLEVWMALLRKVDLKPVTAFSRLAGGPDSDNTTTHGQLATKPDPGTTAESLEEDAPTDSETAVTSAHADAAPVSNQEPQPQQDRDQLPQQSQLQPPPQQERQQERQQQLSEPDATAVDDPKLGMSATVPEVAPPMAAVPPSSAKKAASTTSPRAKIQNDSRRLNKPDGSTAPNQTAAAPKVKSPTRPTASNPVASKKQSPRAQLSVGKPTNSANARDKPVVSTDPVPEGQNKEAGSVVVNTVETAAVGNVANA